MTRSPMDSPAIRRQDACAPRFPIHAPTAFPEPGPIHGISIHEKFPDEFV